MGEYNGNSSGSVLLAFLLGGAVGAGLALLLAPQSGAETRQKIKDLTGEVKDKVNAAIDEGKDFLEDRKSLIATAVQAGKDAYEKERERLSKA